MLITFFDDNNTEINLYRADSYLTRLQGLFSSKASRFDGIVLSPCNAIHTLFFFKSIDVVFLDKQKRILKVCRAMPCFRIISCPNAFYVLELFCGSYQFYFKVGETFEF